MRIDVSQPWQPVGNVAVITAGTSDLPVDKKARETLDWMGVGALFHEVAPMAPARVKIEDDVAFGLFGVVEEFSAPGAPLDGRRRLFSRRCRLRGNH